MQLYLGPSNLCIIKNAKCICKKKKTDINITKNDVAKLTSRPYMRAMSPENQLSGELEYIRSVTPQYQILMQLQQPFIMFHRRHPQNLNIPTLLFLSSLNLDSSQIISTIQLLNLLNLLMTEDLELLMIRHLISSTPKRSLQLSKE